MAAWRRLAWTTLTTACTLTAGSVCGEQATLLYVNRQYGFQLEAPPHWVVYERSAPEVAALLKATQEAVGVVSQASEPGLVVLLCESPLGARSPFNTNMTASVYQLHAQKILPEDLLREAALRMLGNLPPQAHAPVYQHTTSSVTWMWADYRYEQMTPSRRVPIKTRLAMTVDPQRSRYVLVTASCLEDRFAHYEPLFHSCLMSLRWTHDAR